MSKYQVLLCIGVAYLAFSTAPSTQAGIFFSATPQFQCAVQALDEAPFNLTHEQIENFTTPMKSSGVYKSCVRYDQNLTVCEILGDLSCLVATNETVPCGGYWYEDDVYDETPMSEFNIVCDRKIQDTIMNTFFLRWLLSWIDYPRSNFRSVWKKTDFDSLLESLSHFKHCTFVREFLRDICAGSVSRRRGNYRLLRGSLRLRNGNQHESSANQHRCDARPISISRTHVTRLISILVS